MQMKKPNLSRRNVVVGFASAFVAAPTILRAETVKTVQRNASSFRTHNWQDHFDELGNGKIICDTYSKLLQYWPASGGMLLFPTSVPMTDELTRRGYTEVVEKRKNPSWAPTPSMRERNPEWPIRISGGDPENPLGTRALYLSWQYYRIHGTHDDRKIGRASSNGCIGLFNADIENLYENVPVGTQVKVI